MQAPNTTPLDTAIVTLFEDLQHSLETLEASNTQYNRRVYIRVFFALVEGSIHMIKQLTFSHGHYTQKITVPEAVMLVEASYEVKENGRINSSVQFIKLAGNFRFMIRCAEKVFDIQTLFDASRSEWKEFRDCIKVRHRITHPKKNRDMIITDEEIEQMKKIEGWYKKIFTDLFNKMAPYVVK